MVLFTVAMKALSSIFFSAVTYIDDIIQLDISQELAEPETLLTARRHGRTCSQTVLYFQFKALRGNGKMTTAM